MNQAAWSSEDREQYDALVREVVESADATEDRIDLYEQGVADARQAHRFWANDVDRDARRTGYREQIKSWLKRNRVIVNINDRKVSKPRVIGVKRTNDKGEQYDAQALFDVMTFDEIRAKRREWLRQVHAYNDNVALADRLLALEELAPSTATPQEACALLGTSLDLYLSQAA